MATATWTLGSAPGAQHAHVSGGSALATDFTATADASMAINDAITLLALDTPDGSGQTVHPDHVSMPSSWPGASQYLAITPYRDGNPIYENPSIYAGSNETTWAPPPGLQNPIVTPPTANYLSDPDAVYDPDRNELRVYYRQVGTQNVILVKRSTDGVHFDPPTVVAQGVNHTIVSPSIVRVGPADWRMWSVNANIGCDAASTTVELRRSSDGLDWSAPQTVSLSQPGFSAWHIDVQWIPSRQEFWALYNGKTRGSCTTPALYLATSTDGVAWTTYPSPVLAHGAIPEFDDIVYRSTFAYDPASDIISFWYSGARYETPNYVWRSAFQRRYRASVFASITQAPSRVMASLVPGRTVPPLLDAP